MRNVVKGEYNFGGLEWTKISLEAKNFIRRLMTYNPENRCTAYEAL